MNKYLYVLIVLFSFLLSCTSNTVYKKPENLIPKDTMVLLLTDMYIATSAKSIKNKSLQRDINYMVFVYDKYGIDSARFKTSNVYYNSKVEIYSEILSEVKSELIKRRDKYESEYKKQDSIKRSKKKSMPVL